MAFMFVCLPEKEREEGRGKNITVLGEVGLEGGG
jgi:hypothetical protein